MAYLDHLLHSQLSCRGHEEGDYFAGDGFALPGDKPHYPRDRVADIKHVRLDIRLDLDAKRVSGSVAHTFAALNDGLNAIVLDAVELEISGVRREGGPDLSYEIADNRVQINLDSPRSAGEEATVIVD